MKLFRKRDVLPVSIFVVFALIAISIFYSILKPKDTLPIYQPAQVNSKLVDTSIAHRIKYHTVSDFNLINQNGDTITQDSVSLKRSTKPITDNSILEIEQVIGKKLSIDIKINTPIMKGDL